MPTRCCLPCFLHHKHCGSESHHKHCGSERSIYKIPTCFIYKVNICALISQMWKWSPRASERLDDFTWDLVAGGDWLGTLGSAGFSTLGFPHLDILVLDTCFHITFGLVCFHLEMHGSTVENCLVTGFRVGSTWSDWERWHARPFFVLQWRHDSLSCLPWEHKHWSHHCFHPAPISHPWTPGFCLPSLSPLHSSLTPKIPLDHFTVDPYIKSLCCTLKLL